MKVQREDLAASIQMGTAPSHSCVDMAKAQARQNGVEKKNVHGKSLEGGAGTM